MTIENLVEGIIVETGRLIGQLVRLRSPMASVARLTDLLRSTIVDELTGAGEPDAVVADIMGVTVRSVRQWRKNEGAERPRTRAQQILDWLERHGAVTQEQLESELCPHGKEGQEAFTTLVRHLVRCGLIQTAEARGRRVYVRTDLLNHGRWDAMAEAALQVQAVLVELGMASPTGGATVEQIHDALCAEAPDDALRSRILAALEHLESQARVRRLEGDGPPRFAAQTFVVSPDASYGQATSVLEHVKAVMRNLRHWAVSKDAIAPLASAPGARWGATFDLAVPIEQAAYRREALAIVRSASDRLSDLRVRLDREVADAAASGQRTGVLLSIYLGYTAQDVEALPSPSPPTSTA